MKSLLKTFPILSILALGGIPLGAEPPTAWQELAAHGETFSVSTSERRILQVLTPEQARAYAAGEAPESLILPSGETLAEFLRRIDQERAAGLAVKPVEPCVLLDEEVSGERTLFLRRADLGGCGVDDPAGEILKSHQTRALMLSLEVSDAATEGRIKIWPGGGAPEPDRETLAFPEAPESISIPTLIVPICDEESLAPCEDGDLKLAVEGSSARVRLTMHGRLEPVSPRFVPAENPESTEADELTEKAAGDSPWIEGANNVHYLGGKVGIGTASPNSRLVVTSDSTVSGEPKAAATIDAAANTDSEWALNLRAASGAGQVDDLMVVRGDGRVGIGTTSPVTDFHLEGQGYITGDLVLGNNTMIRGESALSGTAAGAIFFNSATPGPSGIDTNPGYQGYLLHNLFWDGMQWVQPRGDMYSQAFTVGHHYDTSWWRSGPTGTNGSPVSLIRSMVIKRNTGHVGIGSPNPASRLVVSHNDFSGHSDWAVAFDSRGSDSSSGILSLRNSSADSVFYARSDGNVGIGTLYPSSTLHVKGSAQVDGPVLFRESGFTGTGSGSSQDHLFRVWGHHPARIEQSHSLGGAGDPPYFAPQDPTLTLLRGSTARGATLALGNQSAMFYTYANQHAMRFYAPDGTTAIQTLTPEGNTGFGVEAPTEKVEVAGNVKVSGDLQLSGNLVSSGDLCIGQCG